MNDLINTTIEAERGRLLLSKKEFSDALGITAKTYNGYISGTPIPTSVLKKMSTITGKSIDYLLENEILTIMAS
ncbi:MAG: helix-turn-helix transcriptional regulator [Oscillospiraceae bacterium]